MSATGRPVVGPGFRIGPWVPGFLLPAAVGAIGIASALLLLHGGLLALGLVLSLLAAGRIRTAAPWVLVGLLVLGQLVRDPARIDASLLWLVLAVHLLVVLTLHARAIPVLARVQIAALGSAARTVLLVQVPSQVLAVLVLALGGLIPVVPAASTIGGALLLLVAGLLVVPRIAARSTQDRPTGPQP